MTENSEKKNVVDLAEARKRQKTVRPGQGATRAPQGPKGKLIKGKTGTVWQYVQLLLFLALVAYMMQLCSGGGAHP